MIAAHPAMCRTELQAKLAKYPHLISLASSLGEDANLSKENYFNICTSTERIKAVGNNACCMVATFAFESLREHKNYDDIKNKTEVRFLGHLRNASAHGNRFNFKNPYGKFKDPGEVEWRAKIIDKKLQDRTAFPDFFAQGDFAYLFEDISKLLE